MENWNFFYLHNIKPNYVLFDFQISRACAGLLVWVRPWEERNVLESLVPLWILGISKRLFMKGLTHIYYSGHYNASTINQQNSLRM